MPGAAPGAAADPLAARPQAMVWPPLQGFGISISPERAAIPEPGATPLVSKRTPLPSPPFCALIDIRWLNGYDLPMKESEPCWTRTNDHLLKSEIKDDEEKQD